MDMYHEDNKWREISGDHGIRSMVSYGVKQVRSGYADGLKFSCFNKDETDLVNNLMREHPHIPYTTTRLA